MSETNSSVGGDGTGGAGEAALRSLLGRHRIDPPGGALAGRILADGMRMTGAASARRRGLRRWLAGAGLVGISLAGAVSGATAVMVLSPAAVGRMPVERFETAFGALAPESQPEDGAEDGPEDGSEGGPEGQPESQLGSQPEGGFDGNGQMDESGEVQ
ncbi:hypothetical protein [Rhizobium sp. SSA_523]|uniref:hypothetical protein n=1 Tax=Rhizobium sp. SSA_523 TaxID=2952477 RepID=UPI002090B2E2|nr:hypothetical protein [Rhizobium sp. SSA_523]MCO5730992.1 hypothetical protein [Rhizobium sp. SSA_523]WKC24203.1 hypothetical protein QTJ18_08980 [Rhizobium sp. SSA_523]